LDEACAQSRAAYRKAVTLSPWVSCPLPHAVQITSETGVGLSVGALPTLCATEPIKRTDRRAGPRAERGGGNGLNLATTLISLPTLTVTNAHGNGYTRDGGQKGKERLTLTGLMRLPTLTASMCTPGDMEGAAFPSADRPVYRSGGGRLNPEWGEWFMGFPMGWTEFQPLAMLKFREWQRQHSLSFPKVSHK